MSSDLKLTLEIDPKGPLVTGQSCFFRANLSNEGAKPREIAARLESHEPPLTLYLRPNGSVPPAPDSTGEVGVSIALDNALCATAASSRMRQGVYVHGNGEATNVSLASGASTQLLGDLLEWFGDVKPGAYTLTGEYLGAGFPVVSDPIQLDIESHAPAKLAAPRRGGVHYSSSPAAQVLLTKGGTLFALRGDGLPRDPKRGVLAPWSGIVRALPAARASDFVPVSHCVFEDASGWNVGYAQVQPALPAPAPQRKPLAIAAGDVILRSPLSVKSGAMFMVVSSGRTLTLHRVSEQGVLGEPLGKVDVGELKSLGAYVCCWDQESHLHLIWCASGERIVRCTDFSLTDPGAPIATRDLFTAPGEVAHLEATVDAQATLAAAGPMFKEFGAAVDDKPRAATPTVLRVFALVRQGPSLTIVEHETHTQTTRPIATIVNPKDVGEVTIVESVLRKDLVPCYLAADATGMVWYASSKRPLWSHLHSGGEELVHMKHTPVLFAGGSTATLPWVYVAWVRPDHDTLGFAKVEPPGEAEPTPVTSTNHHQCNHG